MTVIVITSPFWTGVTAAVIRVDDLKWQVHSYHGN